MCFCYKSIRPTSKDQKKYKGDNNNKKLSVSNFIRFYVETQMSNVYASNYINLKDIIGK